MNNNVKINEKLIIDYKIWRAYCMFCKESLITEEMVKEITSKVSKYYRILSKYTREPNYGENFNKEKELALELFKKDRCCITMDEHMEIMGKIAPGCINSREKYSVDDCYLNGLSFKYELIAVKEVRVTC